MQCVFPFLDVGDLLKYVVSTYIHTDTYMHTYIFVNVSTEATCMYVPRFTLFE